MELNSLYAAFDIYPSAKGAATHIHQMSKALFDHCGSGYLYVLGNERLPTYQDEGNIKIFRFTELVDNYLERAELFGFSLSNFISDKKKIRLVHFRDIWSGLALLGPQKPYKSVFEVNAFMSVELPYRYPLLSKSQIQKIREIEKYCFEQADQIICPSESISQNLIKNGLSQNKVTVITNGAEIETENEKIDDLPEQYILYFGALQYWQGVDDLIKAVAGLKDFPDLKLVICSSNRPSYSKPYKKLAEKLGLSKTIVWNYQLSKNELNTWIKNAVLTVAPFKETERNLIQGFSPLKLFESMAQGIPVIASNLPSVQEIITDKENGRLVRPERPAELSRSIRFLLDYPEYAQKLGANGYKTILEKYLWKQKISELTELYLKLVKFENQ